MAQSFPQLADELDILNLNDSNGKKGSEEEVKTLGPSSSCRAEQELSYDVEKDQLLKVRVAGIYAPNRVIIQFKDNMLNSYSPAKSDRLAKIYTEFNSNKEPVASDADAAEDLLDSRKNAVHKLYLNHKYAIFKTDVYKSWGELLADSDDSYYSDENSSFVGIIFYSIGTIVSFLPDSTKYKVFMCDLGEIRTCTELDMCPIPPGKEFLSEDLEYALVTIPGIVPREGMDSIPGTGTGLETVSFQDEDWDEGAVNDVWNWQYQYKFILLRKLVQESPSLFYGDLYGSNDKETKMVHKEDLLTVYMTRQAHVFFNSELASRVYDHVISLQINSG